MGSSFGTIANSFFPGTGSVYNSMTGQGPAGYSNIGTGGMAINGANGLKGGGASAPPMPDFTGLANAQGANNIQTAYANSRMSNPNVTNPYGSQTVTWDPNGFQANVNQTLNPTGQRLFNLQNDLSLGLGGVSQDALSRVNSSLSGGFDMSGAPGRTSNVAGGPIQNQIDTGGIPNPNFDFSRGPIQAGLNFSGAPGMPDASLAGRNSVEDALYNRATARLDPRFNQGQDQLQSSLVAQGLHPGTVAYDNAMRNFNMAKNDAYSSAQNDAIAGGGAEQSRLFNLGMSARQQGVGETTAQGNFANAAQNQGANQNLQAASLGNAGGQQLFNMRTGQGNFANTAQGLNFTQGLDNANLSNAQRQNYMQEQAYLRQLPLTELNSLRTGSQPGMPNFQNFSGVQAAPAPIFNAGVAQDQGNIDRYNAQMGTQNSLMQTLGTLGAAYFISDRRLKHNIVRVGVTAGGLPLYDFDYVWGEKGHGVMADEVPVELTTKLMGWTMVDYGRIS